MQAVMFAFQTAQSPHNAGFAVVFPANSINQNLGHASRKRIPVRDLSTIAVGNFIRQAGAQYRYNTAPVTGEIIVSAQFKIRVPAIAQL